MSHRTARPRLLHTVYGMNAWLIIDVLLALGVTLRLTRAITVEDIGGRLLRDPAERWVQRAVTAGDVRKIKNRRWWTDALSCPWCVSPYIGIATLAVLAAVGTLDSGWQTAYRIVAGGLTLSYLTGRLHTGFGDSDHDLNEYDEQESTPVG